MLSVRCLFACGGERELYVIDCWCCQFLVKWQSWACVAADSSTVEASRLDVAAAAKLRGRPVTRYRVSQRLFSPRSDHSLADVVLKEPQKVKSDPARATTQILIELSLRVGVSLTLSIVAIHGMQQQITTCVPTPAA
jgi:hypothetical protein